MKFIDANGRVFAVNQSLGDLIIQSKAMGFTGATFQFHQIDPSSFAKSIVDFAHIKIHAGEAFSASIFEADFDKANSIGILFTTPNTRKYIHVLPLVYAGASALFQICEAPTLDVGQYSITFGAAINRNRNSNNPSGILSWRAAPVVNQFSQKVVADASPVPSDGTGILSETIGSGTQCGGGPNRDSGEYMLKQNTTYYFRLAGMASGADNSVASMELVWYEQEPRE